MRKAQHGRLGPAAALINSKKNKGDTRTMSSSQPLWKRVGELGASSAFLLYLSSVGSDRLSVTQAAFFMLAATADAAGQPATRSQLIEAHEEDFKGSIKNTYRQFLEPTRTHPNGLGWLTQESNPDDYREKILKLTPRGRRVIEGALLSLMPMDKLAAN